MWLKAGRLNQDLRGQATLPDLEIFLICGLAKARPQLNLSLKLNSKVTSQVRKAGLPPLF